MNYDYVVGIDPGTQGGVALLDQNNKLVFVSKLSDKGPQEIATLFRDLSSKARVLAYMEAVCSFPGEGATSAHTFGKSVGRLEMACHCFGIPLVTVRPQIWQRSMALGQVTGHRKKAHQAKARLVFPDLPPKSVTLEIADALLIAEFGWRRTFMTGLEGL